MITNDFGGLSDAISATSHEVSTSEAWSTAARDASRETLHDASGSTMAGRDVSTRSRGRRPRGPNAARRRAIRCQLAARDGACCFYCGQGFVVLAEATIDHLVPQCQVPGWKLANLVLACGPCNHAKGDRLPQEFLRPCGFGPGLTPVRTGHLRTLVRAVRVMLAVLTRTVCGAIGVRTVSARDEARVSGGGRSTSNRAASIRPRGASSPPRAESACGPRCAARAGAMGGVRTDSVRTGRGARARSGALMSAAVGHGPGRFAGQGAA